METHHLKTMVKVKELPKLLKGNIMKHHWNRKRFLTSLSEGLAQCCSDSKLTPDRSSMPDSSQTHDKESKREASSCWKRSAVARAADPENNMRLQHHLHSFTLKEKLRDAYKICTQAFKPIRAALENRTVIKLNRSRTLVVIQLVVFGVRRDDPTNSKHTVKYDGGSIMICRWYWSITITIGGDINGETNQEIIE